MSTGPICTLGCEGDPRHFDCDEHAKAQRNDPPARRRSALEDVAAELARARAKFPRVLISAHEGYAVLREEVDELWDDVKGNEPDRVARMRAEAVQVAAMAVRFIEDVCDGAAPSAPASAPDTTFAAARRRGLAPTKMNGRSALVVRAEMIRRATDHLNDLPEAADRVSGLARLLATAWNDGYEAALTGAELDTLPSLQERSR